MKKLTEQKINEFKNAVNGLSLGQWGRVKQQIDMLYSSQADKVELDDLDLLEKNMKREFNC
ncbi:hypothetical protein J2Z32_001929 [Paenibacillus turicensis]|uniref:Uncharacterized protein n=1 Tax=Paenibacillus turicensis TaxID=160487 RepID=A0ABS4FRT7_9BACL|nr:hypothetical protein [Paenibacillus turicensis]MBP1905301.1 hypothetical protein [Paenibacillus turicensis]